MKTKKIVAETMPLALKMVRQQLGENAIIVNTRTIKTGGLFGLFAKQKYEVTAYSVEDTEPKFTLDVKDKSVKTFPNKNYLHDSKIEESNRSIIHAKPQKLYHYYSQQTHEKEQPQKTMIQPSTQSKDSENPLLGELQDMKKMMMTFMMNSKNGQDVPSGLAKWADRLKRQGVDEAVIEMIVDRIVKKYESLDGLTDKDIEGDIFSIVKEIIKKQVPESNKIPEQTRIIHVIGPTGVGKTTSIAKLATEQVLKQKRRVAMITTDVYRIAAVEQLKTYAGILNVPIEVVRSIEELEQALAKLEHYDLIYMDSTGRNYKEAEYRKSISEYLNYPVASDHYLVLSLTSKYEDMEILLKEFVNSPVKKLILTKYDETSSYGAILNIAYHYPYQLAYITNGQSVPEDIMTIDAAMIARGLVGVEE